MIIFIPTSKTGSLKADSKLILPYKHFNQITVSKLNSKRHNDWRVKIKGVKEEVMEQSSRDKQLDNPYHMVMKNEKYMHYASHRHMQTVIEIEYKN